MELPNRSQLETAYARRLSRMNGRLKRELRELLGNPPDPANVPSSFWQRVERESQEENLAMLYLLFLASARFHAFGTTSTRGQNAQVLQTLEIEAERYRDARAAAVSRSYAETSAERFETLARDIEEIQARIATPQTPGGSPTLPPSEAPPLPTAKRLPDLTPEELAKIERGLDRVFGPARAEGVAVTETTAAQTAGGDAGARSTFGISQDDLWITEADALVCPICRPLHRTRRQFWGLLHEGPPAHPNCRCFIQYANQRDEAAA